MSKISLKTNYVEKALAKSHYIPDDKIVTVVFSIITSKTNINLRTTMNW
jgi:hypothetical protein